VDHSNSTKDTVRTRQNSRDPRNPPTIVVHSCDARCPLYNCIPANNSTASVDDSRKDIPLDTATTNQLSVSMMTSVAVAVTGKRWSSVAVWCKPQS